MAARRLLILMLAVLAVSTLAAALVAPPRSPEPTTTATDDEDGATAKSTRDSTGRLVEATMNISRARPETIRARRGDQLALTVQSRTGGQVEMPAFGLIEDVGRDDPARFDLLADRLGTYEVQLAGSGRVIARVRVGASHPTERR
jgi:YD repeat-containing protein